MATDSERIALLVDLASFDAKEKLGRALAAYNAQLALNKGFGNSRRWLGLADKLADAGREYIDQLAEKIGRIASSGDALTAYSTAVESFLQYLDNEYQAAWDQTAPWQRDKAASPPPAWEIARRQLTMAVSLREMELEAKSDARAIAPEAPTRAPSVKSGRPPSDDKILAKADEMKARGLSGFAIASQMRLEPGFENVATTHVRALIKGRWPAGRPRHNGR